MAMFSSLSAAHGMADLSAGPAVLVELELLLKVEDVPRLRILGFRAYRAQGMYGDFRFGDYREYAKLRGIEACRVPGIADIML